MDMREPFLTVPYHQRMRVLLLVLMVALAPLRGWAGELMALQMATQQLAAAAGKPVDRHGGPADHAHSSGDPAPLHSDCLGHTAAKAAAIPASDGAQDVHAAADCPTCSACQSCSLSALAESPRGCSGMQVSNGVPNFVSTTFTSAAPALGLKPPIS